MGRRSRASTTSSWSGTRGVVPQRSAERTTRDPLAGKARRGPRDGPIVPPCDNRHRWIPGEGAGRRRSAPDPPRSAAPRRTQLRSAAPSPTRLARHRRIDRRRRLPLPIGAALAAGVVALGIGVLWIASGAFGPFVTGVVSGFGGFVQTVGAAVGSAPPTEAPPTSDAPVIVPPEQAYTNDDSVDVTVSVPAAVVGDATLHPAAVGRGR